MTSEEKIKILEEQVAQLQYQLRDQQKMVSLGMLVAGIAHEIQNPLNFVMNFSKMSERLLNDLQDIIRDLEGKLEITDQEDIEDIITDLKANVDKVQEHGDRVIQIIRSILLQSRGKENEMLPTHVDHLVHEYVWLSYHSMRANNKNFNVYIHEEYQPNLKQMMVIPQDLCRAVLNVVNNANYTLDEKAQEQGNDFIPELNVKVKEKDNILTISIKDNGKGIPEDVKNRMFTEIVTTKPQGKGTGLGMNITYDIIVNKHHGEILVDTQLGKGTTFTFRIPVKCIS